MAARKKSAKKSSKKPTSNIDKALTENFIALQKVMTHLSAKFDNLSEQISKLLELFEISAKALAEKSPEKKSEEKELVKKLDTLIDQNKTIARGLTLLHEPEEENYEPSEENMQTQGTMQPPAPMREITPPRPRMGSQMGGYQRSIKPAGEDNETISPPEERQQKAPMRRDNAKRNLY